MTHYIDSLREFCRALPHTTEDVQWEHDLLFRIAGKIYCVANLEPAMSATKIAFKCTPQRFAELVEIEGIIPAPYMARNHWVAMTEISALRQAEIKECIRNSYQLVLEKLPKKKQAALTTPASQNRARREPRVAGKKR